MEDSARSTGYLTIGSFFVCSLSGFRTLRNLWHQSIKLCTCPGFNCHYCGIKNPSIGSWSRPGNLSAEFEHIACRPQFPELSVERWEHGFSITCKYTRT